MQRVMKADFKCAIGVVGLGTMGSALALQLESNLGSVAVYNRLHKGKPSVVRSFAEKQAKGRNVVAADTLSKLVAAVRRPRVIVLMISAGSAVDDVLDRLMTLLEEGDMVIDAGNSDYRDTERRCYEMETRGFLYIGAGVSGGVEGARYGASIMLGGSVAGRSAAMNIMQRVSARMSDGNRCCNWFGADGAGHYVKMVHNGIEYAIMQLIAESYLLLKSACRNEDEIADVFEKWSNGRLSGFLMQSTCDILRKRDDEGNLLLDKMRDRVLEKGTGRLYVDAAMNVSMPTMLVTAALNARFLSQQNSGRCKASQLYSNSIVVKFDIEAVESALYVSMLVAYAQGFELLYAAAKKGLICNFEKVAHTWWYGSIVRSSLLKYITPYLSDVYPYGNLLLVDAVARQVQENVALWRKCVSLAAVGGISIPVMAAALSYFDGLRCRRSSAMLIAAQRDYFGKHGYERIDEAEGVLMHADWTYKEVELA